MRLNLAPLLLLGALGCNGLKTAAEVDINADFVNASAIADLDNDGDQDIVIASFGSLQVVPVDAGQFGAPIPLPDVADFGVGLQVADLNGDSLPEIVTSDGLSFQVRNNLGGLSFAAPTNLAVNLNAGSFALADTSGDALPELLGLTTDFSTNATSLAVLSNNGGVFDPDPLLIPLPDNNFIAFQVNTGDLDGDGDQDVLLFGSFQSDFTGEQALQTVLNNGDGTLTPSAAPLRLGTFGFNNAQLSLGDFDKDGDTDLAFVGSDLNFAQTLFLLRNDAGAFTQVALPVKSNNTTAAQLLDLDNDDDLDLVTTTAENEIFGYQTESLDLYINDDGFTLEQHQIRNIDGITLLGGSDLNDDQIPELLVIGNFVDFTSATLFALELR